MTAPGPLARKIAELEADLLVARDNSRHFKAELDCAEEGENAYLYTYGQHRDDHHDGHTCPEDDWKACIRDAGLARIAELEGEVERLHSWGGLMELLDEHWPADIWPMLEDDRKADAGHRVTSAIRWIDRLRAERDQMHDEARAVYNRALYFARALRQHHDTHHHPDGTGCDPEKWATCRAAEWLAEMGQG